MNDVVRQFRDFFVSLKLTVVLLSLGMVLIFAATLDQVNLGIWAVQQKYFHSFFVLWKVGDIPVPVFPGGYFLGGLLLINLISAHFYRFKWSGRKVGIWLAHVGLILLLLGELASGLWQEIYTVKIVEGQTVNYSEHERDFELAVIDTTDANFDDVVAIPEILLSKGQPIQHPKLPFRIVPKAHYPNAGLSRRTEKSNGPASLATTGVGPGIVVTPQRMTYKENERNIPAVFVELVGTSGSLGTWLVSPDIDDAASPQTLQLDGRTWKLVMRPARAYKPFSLTLQEVKHDVYPGTTIPKNYSSKIHLTTPDGHQDRDVVISMNDPLRHGGYAFYQHQMNAGTK
ncbi:MAG TPA: cytochrome c biogenesis protein ResB, partial [Opitutaceae bacterium]|nr:cytochrome c biogenesis protein ResB [Opitutaceae bacterium]